MESRADAELYEPRLDRFLDLSEQEAANSASVMNALQNDETDDETGDEQPPSQIDHILQAISQDVRDRWNGALFALNPKNPDAARHFCAYSGTSGHPYRSHPATCSDTFGHQ